MRDALFPENATERQIGSRMLMKHSRSDVTGLPYLSVSPEPRTLHTFARAVCAVAFRRRSREHHTNPSHDAKSHLYWFLQNPLPRNIASGCDLDQARAPDQACAPVRKRPHAAQALEFPSGSASSTVP